MRIFSGFLVALSLLLVSLSSYAQDSEDLLQVLNPIHSLRADFNQSLLDGHGKALQKSSGKLVLQRPGQFRWDVRHPVPQLIIANNTRLWIYDPDLEQVVVRRVAKDLGKTPAFLLSNVSTAINNDFVVKHMESPQNWQWYSLTPKGKDGMFRVIQLGFLNNQIKEMRMQDNLGHSTVIKFSNVEQNGDVASSMFKFRVPANVDVIDETH